MATSIFAPFLHSSGFIIKQIRLPENCNAPRIRAAFVYTPSILGFNAVVFQEKNITHRVQKGISSDSGFNFYIRRLVSLKPHQFNATRAKNKFGTYSCKQHPHIPKIASRVHHPPFSDARFAPRMR